MSGLAYLVSKLGLRPLVAFGPPRRSGIVTVAGPNLLFPILGVRRLSNLAHAPSLGFRDCGVGWLAGEAGRIGAGGVGVTRERRLSMAAKDAFLAESAA
jgi:hypothetical protein